MKHPFDQLTDSDEFEQLVFDIVEAEGFSDVIWRGPGPDGGRDIEALWIAPDPTGGTFRTRWYVECKWYTDSVPFSEIEPKLLAASAARADYLLIATSSRIRNTALDSVHEWLGARGFPFRLRVWTGRDLLRLAVKHSQVFQRHFPSISLPTWGTRTADYARLQLLSGSSIDRLSWRIAPIMQWVTSSLMVSAEPSDISQSIEELELASYMLRAHEVFSSSSLKPPVCRVEDIKGIAEFALSCCTRRQLAITSNFSSCLGNTSRSMLVCAMFELFINAAMYSEGDPPSTDLRSSGATWRLEVRNKSSETLLPDWPLIGYRGGLAKRRYSTGQGLGCWFISAIAPLAGVSVTWTKERGELVARIEGALA